MAGERVGWFEINAGGGASCTHGDIEICGNEQFHLGRDPELCRYAWYDDLTISRHHLRVHCILYEENIVNAQVAPFVYVTDVSSNGTYLKKSNAACAGSQGLGFLVERNSTFLLDDGDELRLSESVTLTYHPVSPIKTVELTLTQQRETRTFSSSYLVTGRLLGEGGFGKVLVGIAQATQQQLACKLVRLNHMYAQPTLPKLRLPTGGRTEYAKGAKKRWPTKVAKCFREFDIIKDLSHPNIIAIEKVFWSNNTIYMFQELVTGGDLFSYLEYQGGHLNEQQAAKIMFQILKGIEYLHDRDIVHRDLKPDNILMTSLNDNARAVITDFGAARFLPEAFDASASTANKYQRMFSCVGTLDFAAPEIHKANRLIPPEEGYSKSIDMWSIGTIAATILTGEMLFTHREDPDFNNSEQNAIMGRAANCDLGILNDPLHPRWGCISRPPKNFIRSLLVLDDQARMTASESIYHDWFSSYGSNYQELYVQSIADWQPRQQCDKLVERIDTALLYPDRVLLTGTAPAKIASHVFTPAQNCPVPDAAAIRSPQGLECANDDQCATHYPSSDLCNCAQPLEECMTAAEAFRSNSTRSAQCLPDPEECSYDNGIIQQPTKVKTHRNNVSGDARSPNFGHTWATVNAASQRAQGIRASTVQSSDQYDHVIQVANTPIAEQGVTERDGHLDSCQHHPEDEGHLIIHETPPEIFKGSRSTPQTTAPKQTKLSARIGHAKKTYSKHDRFVFRKHKKLSHL
ncbi:hypothetical protein ACN47E_010195 [Coniothyrium glycines]